MTTVGGEVLQQLREDRGWSYARFAAQLERAATRMGRGLPGRESLVRMIRAWEDGEHRPRDYYALFILVYANDQELSTRIPEPGSALDRLMAAFQAMGISMNRRKFLLNSAAGAAGLALGHPNAATPHDQGQPLGPAWQAALRNSLRRGGDGATLIEVVKSVTGQYRRLEGDTPANFLIVPVAGHLQFADQYLSSEDSPDNRALAAALSEASGFAAWLSFDMDDHAAARRHYRAAVRYAQRATSDLLTAYMLGSMAYWALALGDATESLQLVARAKKLDIRSQTGKAWLAVIEASAQAAAKDANATFAALRRAERLPDERPAWPWLHRFDAAKIAGYKGACYLQLGKPADAQRALLQALDTPQPAAAKQRGLLLNDLSAAYFGQGELDSCCHSLGEAFGIAIEKQSAKLLQRVRSLRRQLTPWKTSAPVRELDDFLLASVL